MDEDEMFDGKCWVCGKELFENTNHKKDGRLPLYLCPDKDCDSHLAYDYNLYLEQLERVKNER